MEVNINEKEVIKEPKSLKDKIADAAYFLVPLALFTACLYLHGYWSFFQINIFEYISLTDVAKYAIYPMIYFVIPPIIMLVYQIYSTDAHKKNEEEGETIFFIPYKYSSVYRILIGLNALILLLFVNAAYKWTLIPMAIALTVMPISFGDSMPILADFLPNRFARRVCFVALLNVVLSAYGYGRTFAENVFTGKTAQIVSVEVFREKDAFIAKGLLKGQDRLKLIGTLGDYYFFVSMDNSTKYIVKSTNLYMLEIKPS